MPVAKGTKHPAECGHCAAIRGQSRPTEVRERIANTQRGRQKSPEHRERVREGNIRRFADPTEREKLSQAHRGKPLSESHRQAISRGKTGIPKTESHREALAVAQARALAEGRGPANCGTQPEQIMAALLEYAGVAFVGQRAFGRYCVDFYLPHSRSVVEVDGRYWHRNEDEKRHRRDAYLLGQGVTHIHHVTDSQLEAAGWL